MKEQYEEQLTSAEEVSENFSFQLNPVAEPTLHFGMESNLWAVQFQNCLSAEKCSTFKQWQKKGQTKQTKLEYVSLLKKKS